MEFNRPHASPLWNDARYVGAALEVYSLDEVCSLIAGLVGRTHHIPEWLQIGELWVSAERRRQGIGSQLIRLAETEAIRRGCHFARLATSDYQAPDYYAGLGHGLMGNSKIVRAARPPFTFPNR